RHELTSGSVQVFGRRRRKHGLPTRSSGRRPKSAKARNRGVRVVTRRTLWGFWHGLRGAGEGIRASRGRVWHEVWTWLVPCTRDKVVARGGFEYLLCRA